MSAIVILPQSAALADVLSKKAATTAPKGVPWHSWSVVASSGMSIGHKGMLHATKALGMTMVDIFKDENCSFELMHTVSNYPIKDEDANLKMIDVLRKKFNHDVGYSGHEVGLAVSFAAAALGITSLERHITLSRTMYGSDQSASIEPNGLRQLVNVGKKIDLSMGDGVKVFSEAEKLVAKNLRQHI